MWCLDCYLLTSDHIPIFYISKTESNTNMPKSITSTTRPITESGIQALRADLTNTDWSFVEESTNVDDAYGLFLAWFNELLNFNLPMVKKT